MSVQVCISGILKFNYWKAPVITTRSCSAIVTICSSLFVVLAQICLSGVFHVAFNGR